MSADIKRLLYLRFSSYGGATHLEVLKRAGYNINFSERKIKAKPGLDRIESMDPEEFIALLFVAEFHSYELEFGQ